MGPWQQQQQQQIYIYRRPWLEYPSLTTRLIVGPWPKKYIYWRSSLDAVLIKVYASSTVFQTIQKKVFSTFFRFGKGLSEAPYFCQILKTTRTLSKQCTVRHDFVVNHYQMVKPRDDKTVPCSLVLRLKWQMRSRYMFATLHHKWRQYSLDRNRSHGPLELHMALSTVQLDCLRDPGQELLINLLDHLTLATNHTQTSWTISPWWPSIDLHNHFTLATKHRPESPVSHNQT